MVRPVVHSVKHYVQITLSSVLTGARNNEGIVTAVVSPDANLANEVTEGSIVKAVYMEMWTIGSTADQFFTAIVEKLPSGLGQPSVANLASLFTFANKKNIFYTTQGLASNDGIAAPHLLFKGWIKIPKSKQRFGLGDQLFFNIASRGDATIKYCGFFIYKEYR